MYLESIYTDGLWSRQPIYRLKSYIVKDILCNYRKQIDRTNELTLKIRWKSKTLDNEYTEIVEGFMDIQKGKMLKEKDIRNHLIHNENMSRISASSIKRVLKKKLGYRFKRISTLEYNSLNRLI